MIFLSRNWQSCSNLSVLLRLFDFWPVNVFIGMDLSGCGKCSRVSSIKERLGNIGLDFLYFSDRAFSYNSGR